MRSDLGTSGGSSRHEIDLAFKDSPYSTGQKCLVCGQPAQYRLMAKSVSLNTNDLQANGYVCEYHLKHFDPKSYGIREV